MAQTFGELLGSAIARSGMTRQVFAKRTHTAVSTISEVIMGRRKPPLRRVTTWATVLALSEDECRTWKITAAIAHARPEVQDFIDELQARIQSFASIPTQVENRRRVAETGEKPI